MSQSLLWMRALVLSCIVLCVAFAVRASSSPDQKTGGMVLATVDYKKIQDEYKLKASMESDIKSLQQQLTGALARRYVMPLFENDDQAELDTLWERKFPSQSNPQKKRRNNLKNKEKQFGGES